MALSQLKVCGITSQEDGQRALSVGASFLGFILFDGSPRCITPEKAQSLWKQCQVEDAFSVAVEVAPSPERLEKIEKIGFDFFQLHFPCSINTDRVSEWTEITGTEKLWLAPRISPRENFPERLLPFAETFLLDAYDEAKFGGTGLPSDWERFTDLKNQHHDKKWVLAGGLGPENLGRALAKTNPDIVDVNSAVEKQPGVKDHEKLKKLECFF